jgi:hypothetical protein
MIVNDFLENNTLQLFHHQGYGDQSPLELKIHPHGFMNKASRQRNYKNCSPKLNEEI